MHMSWVLSFNLKYFYKQINNENWIKIKIKKMLYKLYKIKLLHLFTFTTDNDNS